MFRTVQLLLACVVSLSHAQFNCHGNLMALHPSGASATTAGPEGLSYSGVHASETIVDKDVGVLNSHKNCYVQVGQRHCLHPALIAGIASRETHGGNLIRSSGGWGDSHHAYGILQCDVRYHDCHTNLAWDSCEHMEFCVGDILMYMINTRSRELPNWTKEQQLQAGVASYNSWSNSIRNFADVDSGTFHRDYSNDVIARAQRLVRAHGW